MLPKIIHQERLGKIVPPSDFRTTTKEKLWNCSPTLSPGFFPTQESLLKLTIKEVNELRISDVFYGIDEERYIHKLAFGFTNGVMSPPVGSYVEEPCEKYEIPGGESLSQIAFGCTKLPYLTTLTLLNRYGDLITEIKGGGEVAKTKPIVMGMNEHLVSLHVETHINSIVQI